MPASSSNTRPIEKPCHPKHALPRPQPRCPTPAGEGGSCCPLSLWQRAALRASLRSGSQIVAAGAAEAEPTAGAGIGIVKESVTCEGCRKGKGNACQKCVRSRFLDPCRHHDCNIRGFGCLKFHMQRIFPARALPSFVLCGSLGAFDEIPYRVDLLSRHLPPLRVIAQAEASAMRFDGPSFAVAGELQDVGRGRLAACEPHH